MHWSLGVLLVCSASAAAACRAVPPSASGRPAWSGTDVPQEPPGEAPHPANDANKSNNPLNPEPGLNVQDLFTPELYGSDESTNDLLLRGTLPIASGALVPVPQLLRLTVPISTRPRIDDGDVTGLGDINLFDVFLVRAEGTQLGIGPLLTMPTASDDALGTGKWQGGLAAVAIDPKPKRILGALVQWQQSFAGDQDREDVASITFQPFVIVNFDAGWYARSTAIWNFDVRDGDYYIPLGVGAGKVSKVGSTLVNFFLEPQFTVLHDGDGLPQFALFGGVNLTL